MTTTLGFPELLSKFDLGTFLTKNKHLSADKFLLGCKDNTKELNALLAQQLIVYPKADGKIPTFVSNHCWFTSKSYEQASSEASAIFKSKLFRGHKLLDLSGGLGVDDWAFSQSFKQVISLDPDVFLNNLVRENYKKLAIQNIQRLDNTAEDFLVRTEEKFDLIFLDADRRTENGKVFFLDQGKPNFLEIEPLCAKICPQVLLKLSPMVDLAYLKNALPWLAKIWILGDKSEVKEVLALVHFNKELSHETEVIVISDKQQSWQYKQSDNYPELSINGNETYFFEPHPCIIKSNYFEEYATENNLKLIGRQSIYFVGECLPENFIGRSFKLIKRLDFSKSIVKKYLEENGIEQANISKRNFVLEVPEIRKIFKLRDGGDTYLFFTNNAHGEKLFFHCKKID